MHPRFRYFARIFPEERLELKRLNEQTKAEKLGPRRDQSWEIGITKRTPTIYARLYFVVLPKPQESV